MTNAPALRLIGRSTPPESPTSASRIDDSARRTALRFVILIGILSFFSDFTHESARSVMGPFLASLQASGAVVSVVTGFGELLCYALRLVSGRWADKTGLYWPIAIFGYVIEMAAVPALALTDNWPAAAALIIVERVGKAMRNPPRDTMLSHAGREAGGFGWVFGLRAFIGQLGAMCGPLAAAGVLALGGSYRECFAILLVTAVANLSLVGVARLLYPRPHDLDRAPQIAGARLPRIFWIYLAGAALVAAGFADYPLMAYHFSRAGTVSGQWIAVFYSVAMAVSGAASLIAGRLFDRYGFVVVVVMTLISAAFAPLIFLGGFWTALLGAAIWGLGFGVHESIVPAAVAPMVAANRRASAYGMFTAGYGIFWFLGSAAIGVLYDVSLPALIAFCVAAQLAGALVFIGVGRMERAQNS